MKIQDNIRDLTGKIHIQYFTCQTETREVGKYCGSHRFAAEDIDENGPVEYLFVEFKRISHQWIPTIRKNRVCSRKIQRFKFVF